MAPSLTISLRDQGARGGDSLPFRRHRRWKELAGLEDADHREVVAEAVRLLESGDTDDMVLGAEMLDVRVQTQKKIRGSERHVIVRVLRDAASPPRAPAVIAAALGPYAVVESNDQGPLSSAVGHPDPLVRRTAARLLAVVNDLEAPVSTLTSALPQEVLRDLLEPDSDPEVREAAAESLWMVYKFLLTRNGIPAALAVYEYLRPHTTDPLAGVQAAALSTAIDADDDAVSPSVALLVRELDDPRVDWRLLRVVARIQAPLSAEEVTNLHSAVKGLRDYDWPAITADPAQHPDEPDRRTMLEEAIDKLTALMG